ncbi:MAG: hypothetical protein FJZ01_12960 [Candidatus Sericytochromatia bacterium]|nr:hypothetical protein [Candidatus Tanganyikabacteria bacterium]
MFNSNTIKTFRSMTVAAIALFALAGCGTTAIQPATLKTNGQQATLTAKKPGSELRVATEAIRGQLQTSDGKQVVNVRSLDVVAGPTIAIYPPVPPTVFDFTARLEVIALDDRLAQYVVTGSYSTVTKKLTVNSRKPAVF